MNTFLHNTARKTIGRRVPLTNISKMVVDALKALKRRKGVTLAQIANHVVSNQPRGPAPSTIIEKIPVAIQRGVQFGAIKQNGEFYKLDSIMVMASRTTNQNYHISTSQATATRKTTKKRKNVAAKKRQASKTEAKLVLNANN